MKNVVPIGKTTPKIVFRYVFFKDKFGIGFGLALILFLVFEIN